VTNFNTRVFEEECLAKEPAKYKKADELGTEPAKYKKDGNVSLNWVKWDQRRQELEGKEPEVSQNWVRWNEKHQAFQDGLRNFIQEDLYKDLGLFNPQSSKHKQWLFYEVLQYEAKVFTDNESNPQPAVDEEALQGFGRPGALLISLNNDLKLQSMVQSCLDKLDGNLLRVGMKCPGTYTGRLGGSDGLNVQNVPKDEGYLQCWTPPPGHKLLILDFASLEPHVLAAASLDPTLMRIYGPQSTGWDCIYLSVGSQLGGRVESMIRAAGYDPLENTKESVAYAKKEAKDARQIAKVIHLAASYGARPRKIAQTLQLNGLDVTLDQAEDMFNRYWALFAKVKEYEQFLQAQWERNDGWILNPIGRPLAVAQDYIRDIVNRSIQSGGHDCFVLYLSLLSERLRTHGIHYRPYVWDLHDAVMLTVPEEQVAKTVHIMDHEAMDALNAMLGGKVRLKGDTNVVDNWAADKFG
jgi:DNA polymerase I-like protein with 3'-5' exonuclease and polymerase domains